MKKRIISFVLACTMCTALCAPSFASASANDNVLPPWVGEGETWVPLGDIMPLEDFGNCQKGHTCPSGYKLQGYTVKNVTSSFDELTTCLVIASLVPGGNSISVFLYGGSAALIDYLNKHADNPGTKCFKYVYTKAGYAPFVHAIYVIPHVEGGESFYTYLTCETYYEI